MVIGPRMGQLWKDKIMCEPASFVVTKKQVFWGSQSERHGDILAEHKLLEQDVRGNYRVACVEITPPDGDLTLPFSKWSYHLDSHSPQDRLPIWYDAKEVEQRCRAGLKEWRKAKVVMPGETRDVSTGYIIANYGVIKEVRGGIIEEVRGGTIKEIWSGIIEEVTDGIIEEVWGGIIKKVRGGIIEGVMGGTIKEVWGGIIEEVTDGIIEEVRGGVIKEVTGGTIGYSGGRLPKTITGDPTIIADSPLSPDILCSAQAVLVDRSHKTVKCYVGLEK